MLECIIWGGTMKPDAWFGATGWTMTYLHCLLLFPFLLRLLLFFFLRLFESREVRPQ